MTTITVTTAPGTGEDLAAEAKPLQDKDPLKVAIGDIPLPPAHLVDDLDNSGLPTASAEADPVEEHATLDFVGDDLPHCDFTLRYPFRLEGQRVEVITVHQLTVFEVGQIAGEAERSGKGIDLYEIYARMTRLPARVLRRLPATDGEPIVDKCYGFLPRLFRPEGG